mgnify:CR=1 FL=1
MKPLVYQLLVRSWGDNPDGIGKFRDVDDASLKYFRRLGVTHLWLTGIPRHATGYGPHPSPAAWVKGDAGSPYAVTDWFDTNPYLADNPQRRMEEFRDLAGRVHDAGMKVITDFVPNHVARDYGRFFPAPLSGGLDALGHPVLGACDDTSVHWKPENDFYYYPGQPLRLPGNTDYEEFPARASGNCFSPEPGINDWYDTIRLNYCDFHSPTWDKMLQVLLFWLEAGVDGFRCDMVEMVPWQFFKWAIAEVKKCYPQCLFIAEVYNKDLYSKYLNDVGFDWLYDKSGMYDTLRGITESGLGKGGAFSTRQITSCWQQAGQMQPRLLNFLENHDEQRLASDFFAGSPWNGMAALYVSSLFNTAPFMLYSGQEVGERGMGSEGFSGKDGRSSIFDFAIAPSVRRLWREIHGMPSGLSSEEKAVLDAYRLVTGLFYGSKAISDGLTYDLMWCNEGRPGFDPDRHFAFLRSCGQDVRLFTVNFSDRDADIPVVIPGHARDFMSIISDVLGDDPGNPVTVRVPAHGAGMTIL